MDRQEVIRQSLYYELEEAGCLAPDEYLDNFTRRNPKIEDGKIVLSDGKTGREAVRDFKKANRQLFQKSKKELVEENARTLGRATSVTDRLSQIRRRNKIDDLNRNDN